MNKEENELNYPSVKANVYLLADVITLERTKEMDTFFFPSPQMCFVTRPLSDSKHAADVIHSNLPHAFICLRGN